MIGWALRRLVIWGGLGMLVYAVVGYRLALPTIAPSPAASAPSPTVSAPAPAGARSGRDRQVPNALVYRPNGQGHVVLDAAVNGSPVRFLVDTGATFVVLTLADAAAAGFGPGDLVFDVKMSTANGVGQAASVKLREVRLGQFSAYDIPAYVDEHLAISLLGQSFLTRLESYEMRDGVLTLNWN